MKSVNNYKILNEVHERINATIVSMSEEDIEDLNIFFQEIIVKMKENLKNHNKIQ